MELKHSIYLRSVQNARELGGYVTADSRRIKQGRLLRTAALYGITDEDIVKLTYTFRVARIIDFRMPMEKAGAEDPPISGASYHQLDVIDQASMTGPDSADMDFKTLGLPEMVEITERSGMLNDKMYIGFLSSATGIRAYSDFFRLLLEVDPDRAVLWHCTSGKDRTGIAAMLMLSLLGVDESSVLEDYMLTNEYNAHRIEGTRQYLKAHGYDRDLIEKAVLIFDSVNERYMINAMEYLKKRYGSVMGFIRDELKLSQSDIDSLKEKYLE